MNKNNQGVLTSSFKAFETNLYSTYNDQKYPMPPTRGLSANTRSSPNLLAFNNMNKNVETDQSHFHLFVKQRKSNQQSSNLENFESKLYPKKIDQETVIYESENNSIVKNPNYVQDSTNQANNGMQSETLQKKRFSDFETKLNAEMRNMKENTNIKPKPNQNANSYTPEEYYFTMFSGKNKHRSIGNSQQNSEVIERGKNENASNVNEGEVLDMRNEYNRLRKHMEEMEKENRKLKEINSKLTKENKNYESFIKSTSFKEGNIQFSEKTEKMDDSLPSIRDENPDKLELFEESTDSDLFDLLKRAQFEILSRDKQIKKLEAKIENQHHSQSGIEENIHEIETLIKKYVSIESNDETSEAIQTFAKLALRYQSESNLIKTKLAYVYSQYQNAFAQFNALIPIFENHQAKILEKEVKIEVEVENTKEVLGRWKEGQKVEKLFYENDEQIEKEANQIWERQRDTEKEVVNNLLKYDKLHSIPINQPKEVSNFPEMGTYQPNSKVQEFKNNEPFHNFTFRSHTNNY